MKRLFPIVLLALVACEEGTNDPERASWVNVCVADGEGGIDRVTPLDVRLPEDGEHQFVVGASAQDIDLPTSFSMSWDDVPGYRSMFVSAEIDDGGTTCVEGWAEWDFTQIAQTDDWVTVCLRRGCADTEIACDPGFGNPCDP